jgi:hypothetical protein
MQPSTHLISPLIYLLAISTLIWFTIELFRKKTIPALILVLVIAVPQFWGPLMAWLVGFKGVIGYRSHTFYIIYSVVAMFCGGLAGSALLALAVRHKKLGYLWSEQKMYARELLAPVMLVSCIATLNATLGWDYLTLPCGGRRCAFGEFIFGSDFLRIWVATFLPILLLSGVFYTILGFGISYFKNVNHN